MIARLCGIFSYWERNGKNLCTGMVTLSKPVMVKKQSTCDCFLKPLSSGKFTTENSASLAMLGLMLRKLLQGYMYVCMYVHMYILYIHTHTHLYIHIHTHTFVFLNSNSVLRKPNQLQKPHSPSCSPAISLHSCKSSFFLFENAFQVDILMKNKQ